MEKICYNISNKIVRMLTIYVGYRIGHLIFGHSDDPIMTEGVAYGKGSN